MSSVEKLFVDCGLPFSVGICTAFVADGLPEKLAGTINACSVSNRLLGLCADIMRHPCTDFLRSELLHPL